ncbi:EFR1 family ferrodoxin [Clostridium tagluense]|uniref:EFR1 family ferrodoxin n=1 Tax=Clostridium tagluense TaxID=360422 RepID=UPI001C0C2E59|nr:EFR1 family ferrodoxin [Clostridium tagluense]MBU3126199.1 EFR1 family ferrodoxin [Clostridium tagluense]
MIFYFSGTGNSLYVGKSIAKENNENLVSISATMRDNKHHYEYTLNTNEVIGIVYPVYAWSPPKQVIEFINKLKLINYNNNYIFTVATCGANIGNTAQVIDKALKKKNLHLNSGFSVVMPNNYIFFGDVDTVEVENKKLLESKQVIATINNTIKHRVDNVYQLEKGMLPRVMTYIVNPLFNKNAHNTKNFHVNEKCNGCGLCEKVCNSGTITVKEKPIWKNNCTQCLACIHLCPTKAIQYGKGTEKKGRYKHPKITVNELIIKKLNT